MVLLHCITTATATATNEFEIMSSHSVDSTEVRQTVESVTDHLLP